MSQGETVISANKHGPFVRVPPFQARPLSALGVSCPLSKMGVTAQVARIGRRERATIAVDDWDNLNSLADLVARYRQSIPCLFPLHPE